MKTQQWINLLEADYLNDEEWDEAWLSACHYCSCAVGIFVLGDDVIENPDELPIPDRHEINDYVESKISIDQDDLGTSFSHAICTRDIKEARKIWNKIHGDLKWIKKI